MLIKGHRYFWMGSKPMRSVCWTLTFSPTRLSRCHSRNIWALMGKIKVKRIRLMAVITIRNTPFTKSMRTLLSEEEIKKAQIYFTPHRFNWRHQWAEWGRTIRERGDMIIELRSMWRNKRKEERIKTDKHLSQMTERRKQVNAHFSNQHWGASPSYT